ncbi:MAG: anti-sigma factor family protein [Chitinophagaceae bacterium]
MNTQHSSEERLWDYIDGNSSPEEKTVIEQLLASDAEWRAKYSELLEVQQLLSSSELEAPSMRFAKNVMEEIAKLHIAPATKTYINKKIIWGIGIFFITLVVGFLVYGFGQVDWTVESDSKLPVDFGKVDYSKIFSNTFVNVFMMVNVILGLFLLDRFLASKRKKFREEA